MMEPATGRMETLGEYLQRHRKVGGYSLEDVARITRINPHYLKAIEENDYEKLPAPAFTMGFLRSYARLLSLNEVEVVRRYQESLPPPSRKGTAPLPDSEKTPWNRILERIPAIPADLRVKTWAPLIAAVLGGVVVVGILLVVFRPFGREEPSTPSALQESVPPPEAEFPPPPPREATPAVPPREPAPPPPSPPAQGGEPLVLTYEAREETWLSVVIDGGEVRSALLKPGERVQWTARERFLLTLGNAGGGDLFLNRRPLGTLGDSGQVLRGVQITREGAALPSVIPGVPEDSSTP